MKIKNIFYALLAGISLLATACSKEGDVAYKADVVPITVKGYNGGNESLDLQLDTFKFSYSPNAVFDQRMAYSFLGGRNSVKLSITENGTGKSILEKEIKKGDTHLEISFFYMDGKADPMPEVPPAEADMLKIRFMFRPVLTNYSEPVDIALVKYYFTPKVFEEMGRLKNVKPGEFSESITIPTFSTSQQVYNGVNTAVLFRAYIYKAGTNEFYTEGTDYTWHATSSSVPLPPASVASSKVFVFSESALGSSIRFIKNFER